MNKRIIVAFALSLAMVLSLSACGNSSNGTTTSMPSSSETAAATPAVNVSGSDTGKTCLLDKFHNILFGTIDTEEICMDFYLDGNNITAFYISKDSENEIKLVGNLEGFKITFKRRKSKYFNRYCNFI